MANENEGKKVLVTGASGGIGREIAVDCAKAGYYVICHYNHGKEKAEETLRLVKEAGSDGDLIQFDVTNRDDCKAKLDAMTEKHGILWGVVNNAGIARDNSFAGMSGEEWDDVMRTNLDSFYNVLSPLVLTMASRKNKRGGRIITMASVSGVIGNRGQVNYSAAKAGIISATKALGTELAKRGVTCNAVAPGIIETDMTKDLPEEIIQNLIPMGRAGKVSEVAPAVVFLLSESASYITREVININGGIS